MGRALYPRYYWVGGGEVGADDPYTAMDFPRLAFTLIGPAGQTGVVLPGRLNRHFQNAADVIVLGCRSSQYVDALVVFMPDNPSVAFARAPGSPLRCPLRQPICADKTTCY